MAVYVWAQPRDLRRQRDSSNATSTQPHFLAFSCPGTAHLSCCQTLCTCPMALWSQVLEVSADAELRWNDMCGLTSTMLITAKPDLQDVQFCLEARWDAADVQCRQAPPSPGVPPPAIPPAPPPPWPPVPEAPPNLEGKTLRRWERASHAKMMRDADAATEVRDLDEVAVPPAPPPPSPPPRAPAGAMAAPQLNIVLRQIVLATTGDQVRALDSDCWTTCWSVFLWLQSVQCESMEENQRLHLGDAEHSVPVETTWSWSIFTCMMTLASCFL